MIGFAALVDALAYAQGGDAKARILARYLATNADPDRGLAVELLTGRRGFAPVKPAVLRALAAARVDPVLFDLSRDFVGDILETIALLWPAAPTNAAAPRLAAVIDALALVARADLPAMIAGWLDAADPSIRVVLLKLITGASGLGVSPDMVVQGLVVLGDGRHSAAEIAAMWHTQTPPLATLLAWVEGRGPRPAPTEALYFRPVLRPQTVASAADLPDDNQIVEWRWDGVRVQLAAGPGGARLFSARGLDLSAAFPDIIAAMRFHAVLDGVLLRETDGEPGPFAAPHPRLGRKTVGAKVIAAHRLSVRLVDLVDDAGEDLRALPFATRRARLEAWFDRVSPAGMALSALLPDLDRAMPAAANGLVYKSRSGQASWQVIRAPPSRTAVLLYAERNGSRTGPAYAGYTVGLWRDDGTLVPVGRADASGLGDAAHHALDAWIGAHTTERFGPVSAVAIGLAVTIGFDAVRRSRRHKSGVVLENLRILAILAESDAASADPVGSL